MTKDPALTGAKDLRVLFGLDAPAEPPTRAVGESGLLLEQQERFVRRVQAGTARQGRRRLFMSAMMLLTCLVAIIGLIAAYMAWMVG